MSRKTVISCDFCATEVQPGDYWRLSKAGDETIGHDVCELCVDDLKPADFAARTRERCVPDEDGVVTCICGNGTKLPPHPYAKGDFDHQAARWWRGDGDVGSIFACSQACVEQREEELHGA